MLEVRTDPSYMYLRIYGSQEPLLMVIGHHHRGVIDWRGMADEVDITGFHSE
jgi:hypothetical protein